MTDIEKDSKWVSKSLLSFSPERTYPGRYRAAFHRLVANEVKGVVLDIGSGGGGTHDRWEYHNADAIYRTDLTDYANLDLRGDGAQLPFKEQTFDSVICSAVLEHVPLSRFGDMIEETYRVLKPGGKFYSVCAFNYPLHGEPHDFFRPTIYGLQEIAEHSGYEIELLYRGGTYIDTVLHTLYSPFRRICMFLGSKRLSGVFAVIHYPVVLLAKVISLLLIRSYGENPFGSRWYLTSGMVARRPE